MHSVLASKESVVKSLAGLGLGLGLALATLR